MTLDPARYWNPMPPGQLRNGGVEIRIYVYTPRAQDVVILRWRYARFSFHDSRSHALSARLPGLLANSSPNLDGILPSVAFFGWSSAYLVSRQPVSFFLWSPTLGTFQPAGGCTCLGSPYGTACKCRCELFCEFFWLFALPRLAINASVRQSILKS